MENNGSGDLASQPSISQPVGAISPVVPQSSPLRQIFLGPNGIRAGWRLLIYFATVIALTFAVFSVLMRLLHHHRNEKITVMNPVETIVMEAVLVLIAFLAAILMRRIEHEKWDHYGLPLARAFRREFWLGTLWGFGGLSAVVFVLWLTHCYSIDSVALHGITILKYGALWALGFLFVGLYEEFIMRGYSLYTLASGITFWPSAVILSLVFFLGHVHNSGEDWLGLANVFLFGMFACFTLWKTGSLWFAVGVHAAWDWGQTFFYSTPDSGLKANGQLLNVHISGPVWLSGGAAGPEGSLICAIFLLLSLAAFAVIVPKRKWVGQNDRRRAVAPLPQPTVLIDPSALRS